MCVCVPACIPFACVYTCFDRRLTLAQPQIRSRTLREETTVQLKIIVVLVSTMFSVVLKIVTCDKVEFNKKEKNTFLDHNL